MAVGCPRKPHRAYSDGNQLQLGSTSGGPLQGGWLRGERSVARRRSGYEVTDRRPCRWVDRWAGRGVLLATDGGFS